VLEQNTQFGAQPVAACGSERMELEKLRHDALNSFSRMMVVGIESWQLAPLIN
jgi:hypothetical protein